MEEEIRKSGSSPNGIVAAEEGAKIDDDDSSKLTPEPEKKSGKKNSHPLAALQMLCDKTEKSPKLPPANAMYGSPSDPGAILAFSWACNQAVVNESLLKCPFCDTPFISKGAYRHHLSKMHFVKDGANPDPKMFMNYKNPENSPKPEPAAPEAGEGKEESSQSKFQKYSQLAKQLSLPTQP